MIDFLWINSGKLDGNSSEFLAKLCGIFRVSHQKRAQKLWENISRKFKIVDGIITHRRVTKEIQRQAESRLRRSEAGKKGMESRWNKDNNAIPQGITKDNPSSSTSTSSTTTVKKNTKKKTTAFPPELDTLEFHTIWKEWIQFRIERKKKLTPTTITRQLKTLSKHPVAIAIATIEKSIESGWQGLFPERQYERNNGNPIRSQKRADQGSAGQDNGNDTIDYTSHIR